MKNKGEMLVCKGVYNSCSLYRKAICLILFSSYFMLSGNAQEVNKRDTTVEMKEVMVTARSEIRKLKESAMPISVIGQRQLQGTATNINDVLARTVGVTVRNTGGLGSASRISLRGLEGKRMGMYVDEVPMSQLSNFVALNDIPTNMIERIEVYKGIVPYKFGGSALGGAVNVVTKEYPPVYFDLFIVSWFTNF